MSAENLALTLGQTLPDDDVGWRLLSALSKSQLGSRAAFERAEQAYRNGPAVRRR